jgi:membrane protein
VQRAPEEEIATVRAVTSSPAGRAVAGTLRTCLRYRVTGLAAEAGFFTLLSLPAFVLGLVASAGYVGQGLGTDVVGRLRVRIAELAGTALTPDVVHGVILRTFDEVLRDGRPEVLSVGFLLSVWSGSRALGVVLDTVAIMYGLGGRRGIVRTRALSLALYVAALAAGVVVLPLLLLGPGLLARVVPGLAWLPALYWPVLAAMVVAALTGVYHVAPPAPTSWRRCLPGAGLTLGLWVLVSVALRAVIGGWTRSASVYGPLAAPVALLVWLYLLALAVLVGAALNATLDATLEVGAPGTATAQTAGGAVPARTREERADPSPEPAAGPVTRSSSAGSFPRIRGRVGDDRPQVRRRHAERGGHVGEPAPVGVAGVGQSEHEVGETA